MAKSQPLHFHFASASQVPMGQQESTHSAKSKQPQAEYRNKNRRRERGTIGVWALCNRRRFSRIRHWSRRSCRNFSAEIVATLRQIGIRRKEHLLKIGIFH
jgi:hypothetical protein